MGFDDPTNFGEVAASQQDGFRGSEGWGARGETGRRGFGGGGGSRIGSEFRENMRRDEDHSPSTRGRRREGEGRSQGFGQESRSGFGQESRSGFGQQNRNNSEERFGSGYNSYKSDNRDVGFGNRNEREQGRRGFSDNLKHGGTEFKGEVRSPGGRLYSDDDTRTRDQRAGFAGSENHMPNGRDNDFGRGGRDNGFSRGGRDNDFGRGGRDNDFGRGGRENDFGRGGRENDFGRGGRDNDFGRGGRENDFGRGGRESDFGRGGRDNDFGRGGRENDCGRGGRSNDFGRGGGRDIDSSDRSFGDRRTRDARNFSPSDNRRGFGYGSSGFSRESHQDNSEFRSDSFASRGARGGEGRGFGGDRDDSRTCGFGSGRGTSQREFGNGDARRGQQRDFDDRSGGPSRGGFAGRGRQPMYGRSDFDEGRFGESKPERCLDSRWSEDDGESHRSRWNASNRDQTGGRPEQDSYNRRGQEFGGDRFGGKDSWSGERRWGNNERDGSDRGWRNNDRDRRDGRAAESSSFGGRGTSGFGQGSGTGEQRGYKEFVSGGNGDEVRKRAPRDWDPENTAIETLFERDATNAAHFENERDDPVEVIGAPEHGKISSWENSGLHPDLIKTCVEKCRYTHVRPIQAAAIPLIMSGYDVMGLAETGGGKTAAFVLPILHSILTMQASERSSRRADAVLALVVAPTRELAKQLYDSFRKHSYDTDVKCCVAYGEIPRWKNLQDIHKGCDVLIGTSGRLMDFIQKADISVANIRFLVLDEADMLLEDGRESHLRSILNYPKFPAVQNRQTLLFSATFPKDVERFAGNVLKPKYVMIRSSGRANVRVIQRFVEAEGTSGKNEKLFEILEEQRDKTSDDGKAVRTLVFVKRKQQADFLALMLLGKDIKAGSINGNRPQDERERAVQELRDGSVHVLVGTDVCQRGLDITGLDHVINYDLPDRSAEEIRDVYIHRIGRTGRLHNGVATTFVDPRVDRNVIKPIIEVAKETDQEVPEWLEQLSKDDSFSRAGFGNTGFGCSSGFGESGFGESGFGGGTGFGGGGFGDGGFGSEKAEDNKEANADQELGSATFGEGGFGTSKADEKRSSDGEDGSW